MTLGFTVAELAPSGRGPGSLRMGLSRVDEAEWLWPEVDRVARAAVFGAHPEAVQQLAGSEAAVAELCAILGASDLGSAGRQVWEDLCLLQPRGDSYVLTAAAVGFPTDWRLADKIGRPLAAIHAPIHGYAEKLSAGVEHFFQTLPAGPIYGRANWFVVPSAEWRYLPTDDPATRFAHVTAENAGETLFVRCERQTLRRLPASGAILFTIGIAVAALGSLPLQVIQGIATGVGALSPGERERRGAPHYAPALLAYAEACGAEAAAA